MSLVNPGWMQDVAMKRVICHWTAGAYQANALDLAHYHILIEGDGRLVRGTHLIADNVSTADGVYAAHTGGINTGSIGVTICSMANAIESPFNPGPYPMLQSQWDVLVNVVAELCQFYRIPVTPQTVLGHGEVHVNLGTVENATKWDPMVLPWNPQLSRTQVGTLLRAQISNAIASPNHPAEAPVNMHIVVKGVSLPSDEIMMNDGVSAVMIRPVSERLGWQIAPLSSKQIDITISGVTHTLPMDLIGDRGFVDCRDLANAFQLGLSWNPDNRTVTLG